MFSFNNIHMQTTCEVSGFFVNHPRRLWLRQAVVKPSISTCKISRRRLPQSQGHPSKWGGWNQPKQLQDMKVHESMPLRFNNLLNRKWKTVVNSIGLDCGFGLQKTQVELNNAVADVSSCPVLLELVKRASAPVCIYLVKDWFEWKTCVRFYFWLMLLNSGIQYLYIIARLCKYIIYTWSQHYDLLAKRRCPIKVSKFWPLGGKNSHSTEQGLLITSRVGAGIKWYLPCRKKSGMCTKNILKTVKHRWSKVSQSKQSVFSAGSDVSLLSWWYISKLVYDFVLVRMSHADWIASLSG